MAGVTAAVVGMDNSSICQEFYLKRRKPELAEAGRRWCCHQGADAVFIKRSEATILMRLEIELQEASEAFKVE